MDWRAHKGAIAAGAILGAATAGWYVARARSRQRAVKKGVFIEHSLYDAPAETLRELGITWVLVQTGIMKPDREAWITRDRDELDVLAHRLNPPGSPTKIEIWGWGWPIPSRVDEFAEHTREILASPLVTGYCLDIEAKSWSTRDHGEALMDERARRLIAEVRKGAAKPLMLSSHGRADLTPLPWEALAQLDAGMPQCYDAKGVKEPGFVGRCVKSYRELGFPVVIPTLGASGTDAEQMQRQLEDLPTDLGAVSWWTWTQIGRSEERAEIVRACCSPRQGARMKALAASVALLAAYEGGLALARFERRKRVYAAALARARCLGRPLVVVGDPDAGAHTRFARAYPCGDVCVDLRGCPLCPESVEADVTAGLRSFEDDSAVVYVSCVLEYVSDAEQAEGEFLRIAGRRENLFVVYVDPWSFTSVLYPGARWRSQEVGVWKSVSKLQKASLAAALVAGCGAVLRR